MKMKTSRGIRADVTITRGRLRRLFSSLVLAAVVTVVAASDSSTENPQKQTRTLTFAERVAYQRAIEDVYWRHRIWPENRPDLKPSLNAVISQAQLKKKVSDYLRNSQVVDDYGRRPISTEQLQAEMDRMAQCTRQPEVLRELFEALGNDPFVIAECLARPVVAERLVADLAVVAGVPPAPTYSFAADNAASTNHRIRITANVSYTLPNISEGNPPCIDDTWTDTSTTNAPTGRISHTAVWSGTEMIIWGGYASSGIVNTGAKYTPSTDSWAATNTSNAPIARETHTAVWTGNEMIVWGGYNYPAGYLNTGGRYNPATDSWTATSTTNAPNGRISHTAVWTGSEMIVWGGYDSFGNFNTGGRYNPSTDSWTATSITNAPSARAIHTAVWTGTEMIVWGGFDGINVLNTGGRYDPGTDSWVATSTANAPSARYLDTAIWTDDEMIVWGGADNAGLTNTGGRYNPSADSWTPTSTTNAPTARDNHTAVLAGNEMIVWGGGGASGSLNTGGRYDSTTDTWTVTSTVNAPVGRVVPTAVWTGDEMIVWGGTADYINFLNTGGRYCAQSVSPTITLRAEGRKVHGINTVGLTWTGASSARIDVYRDRMPIVRTANDGSYIDCTGDTGRARYRYRVCEAGTSTCSNTVRVTFCH